MSDKEMHSSIAKESLDGHCHDYHQQIARAAFADMLHDTERNQLYEKAIKIAIDKMHSQNKPANVLDIGTGTGLLSMMAARNGADSIVACEEFCIMSKLATQLIDLNGFKDKIRVISKRSTHLTVGEFGDLEEKCNILVTEVFDTELIGEYALEIFKHAHEYLLEDDCIVVPNNAAVYVQVVECPLAQKWTKLNDFYNDDTEILLKIPDSIKSCTGNQNVIHDIQLSQLPVSSFNTIVPPTVVFNFDWSGKSSISYERSSCKTVKVINTGIAQMVFFWWELQMDIEGQYILSCAPYWAHPKSKEKLTKEIPWRDHWIQGIYFLPNEVIAKKNQKLNLLSSHDKFSFWFNISLADGVDNLLQFCKCGIHSNLSRTRLGQINDLKRQKKYLRVFEKHVNENSTVIVLGDSFYYALVVCNVGARIMFFLETNPIIGEIFEYFVQSNEIVKAFQIPHVNNLRALAEQKDVIILGEPFYNNSLFPWDNLKFVNIVDEIKQFLLEDVKIFPMSATIKGIAVEFADLHKIKSPLGQVEGFSVQPFDKMIMDAIDRSDGNIDLQPLWEYPARAASDEFEVARIEVNSKLRHISNNLIIKKKLPCNGIALWIDWHLDESPENIVSTGPVQPVTVGNYIEWYMHAKQGVVFIDESKKIGDEIHCGLELNILKEKVIFKFCQLSRDK